MGYTPERKAVRAKLEAAGLMVEMPSAHPDQELIAAAREWPAVNVRLAKVNADFGPASTQYLEAIRERTRVEGTLQMTAAKTPEGALARAEMVLHYYAPHRGGHDWNIVFQVIRDAIAVGV